MHNHRLITICAVLFLVAANPVNHCFAEDATKPLDLFLINTNTFQAKFVQTLINKEGKKLEQLSGMFQLQRPGQFYWSYETPYIQQIVINGDTIWFYDKELEQVIIKKMADSAYQTPAAIILEYKNARARFNTTQLGVTEGKLWIELIPHDREALYSKIHIGFSGNQLSTMLLFDKLDQVTRLDFLETKQNQALDTSLFNFIIPAGVDVFDEREKT